MIASETVTSESLQITKMCFNCIFSAFSPRLSSNKNNKRRFQDENNGEKPFFS